MAVLAAAQLLDELMGRNRNINPNEKVKKPNWEDPEYCKYYMVKFCPHDLFVNTRADLGVCQRVHDDEVKELFQKADPCYKKSHYQDEFLRFCQNMLNDVERKIQKGKQRLELMNTKTEGIPLTQAQTEKNQEQVKLLTENITSLEREAEEAGTRGDVEQAQGLMKLCDQLKEEKEQLLKQMENSHWTMTAELAAAQEKQMEVCQVCGAFLIVGDAQQRIDDHLTGKQHVGYFKLQQAFDEMTSERERVKEEKERRRREERAGRGGGLGSERDRERRADRDKERGRGERPNERAYSRPQRFGREEEKERERGNSRHSEREKKHRHDRDRGSSGKERSRESTREGSRRHRSRSRDRSGR